MSSMSLIEWFRSHLSTSDSAAVKLQYLQWHAEEHHMTFTETDPLFVEALCTTTSSSSGSGETCFPWTLSEVLWRTRLISLDERTLWECLDAAMIAERVRSYIDPWNEQLAVKLAYYLLHEQPLDDAHWSVLRTQLDEYAAQTIKPQGMSTVDDYISLTSPSPSSDRAAHSPTDAVVAEWSDKVVFVPMETGNDFSEGSLRCAAPVSSCGVLLQVPRGEMFFRDTILIHSALGCAIAAAPSLRDLLTNEEAMLVLCLTYERFVVGQADSHWRRLLAQCPAHYPTIPTTWALTDLTELDGLDMLDEVLAKRAQLQAFADQLETSLLPLLQDALAANGGTSSPPPPLEVLKEAFCWDHLAWAQSTFDSRAFNLNVDGAVVMALVPLADMINHTNRTDVLIRKVEPDGGPFTMQVGAALTAADVGRELWMSYGPLQNWELLQHYGFVLGCDNVHDKLPFPLAVPDTSASAADEKVEEEEEEEGSERYWDARRRALLRRYGLCLPGRCWIGHNGVPPPALLAILRVQLAQADEFDVMERHRYGPFVALSEGTEAAVVMAVRDTVQCVLDVFPTTLEDDEAILAELAESAATAPTAEGEDEDAAESMYNYTLCVQLRIGLKRIADRALQWCSQRE